MRNMRNSNYAAALLTDNVRDNRVAGIDHPFQTHAQVGLRVHRIVIGAIVSPKFWNCFLELFYFQIIQDTVSSFRDQIDEKPNNVRQAGQHSLQRSRRKHTSTIHHNLENPLKNSARSLAVQIHKQANKTV